MKVLPDGLYIDPSLYAEYTKPGKGFGSHPLDKLFPFRIFFYDKIHDSYYGDWVLCIFNVSNYAVFAGLHSSIDNNYSEFIVFTPEYIKIDNLLITDPDSHKELPYLSIRLTASNEEYRRNYQIEVIKELYNLKTKFTVRILNNEKIEEISSDQYSNTFIERYLTNQKTRRKKA